MSLDVYLVRPESTPELDSLTHKIFVREGGTVREVSQKEWDERYPGREPYMLRGVTKTTEIYSANITHNLVPMAKEVGLHVPLWRPEELDDLPNGDLGIVLARDLIKPIRDGLEALLADRERLLEFNPTNGWGNYDLLVSFTADYLAACETNPDCRVEVSR